MKTEFDSSVEAVQARKKQGVTVKRYTIPSKTLKRKIQSKGKCPYYANYFYVYLHENRANIFIDFSKNSEICKFFEKYIFE